MIRRPPRSTRTDTLFPDTTLFRSEALTVDATIDGSRTLGGGIAPTDPINPHHPVASGGHLGESSLGEDFTALTLGAAWQKDRWSARVRGEYRDGETAHRRSEEHTSELQSLMRISYAVFCLKK